MRDNESITAVRYGHNRETNAWVIWQGVCDYYHPISGASAAVPCVLAVDDDGCDLAAVRIDCNWIDALRVSTLAWRGLNADQEPQDDFVKRITDASRCNISPETRTPSPDEAT